MTSKGIKASSENSNHKITLKPDVSFTPSKEEDFDKLSVFYWTGGGIMPLATLLQRWQPAGQKSYKTTKGEVCSCGVCQAKEIVCRSEKGRDWIFSP